MAQPAETQPFQVFIGKTPVEEGFREPVIRVTALQGLIRPRDAYTRFIALYPNEVTPNRIQGYGTRFHITGEQTVNPTMLMKQVRGLKIPEDASSSHTPAIVDTGLRTAFELAAARLGQPSVVVGFTSGEKQETITLFSIEGMTDEAALELIQAHVNMSAPLWTPATAE